MCLYEARLVLGLCSVLGDVLGASEDIKRAYVSGATTTDGKDLIIACQQVGRR